MPMDNNILNTDEKPESFQNLETFARAIFAVPKAEVDALEKQEKKDKKQADKKPAK